MGRGRVSSRTGGALVVKDGPTEGLAAVQAASDMAYHASEVNAVMVALKPAHHAALGGFYQPKSNVVQFNPVGDSAQAAGGMRSLDKLLTARGRAVQVDASAMTITFIKPKGIPAKATAPANAAKSKASMPAGRAAAFDKATAKVVTPAKAKAQPLRVSAANKRVATAQAKYDKLADAAGKPNQSHSKQRAANAAAAKALGDLNVAKAVTKAAAKTARKRSSS